MKRPSHAAGNFTRGLDLLVLSTKTQLRSAYTFVLVMIASTFGLWAAYVVAMCSNAQLDAASKWGYASFVYNVLSITDANVPVTTQGGTQQWPAGSVVSHPYFMSAADVVSAAARDGILISLGAGLALAVAAIHTIRRRGRDAHTDEVVRGPELVDGKALARLVRKRGKASDIIIGDVPLAKGTENRNMVIVGAPRTGKSVAMVRIQTAIERMNCMAVVYDRTGEFIQMFYDPSRGDVILNPLDARSPPWSPWAEIDTAADAKRIANAFIPPTQGDNKFFHDAARALFTALINRVGALPNRSVAALMDAILVMSRDDKRAILDGTEAAKFFDGSSEAGRDVDMTMSTYTEALRYLPVTAGGQYDFSIRDFIRNVDKRKGRQPWLFLAAHSTQMDILRPLVTCFIDCVCSTILSLTPNHQRRIFITLDEWPSLQEIPMLESIMAEGGKYGASVFATMQQLSQLEKRYGEQGTKTVLGLMQTKVLFRAPERTTAEWFEAQLGRSMWERPNESVRFATSETMDGIQLSNTRQQEPIVLASDIITLPDLNCFIQLPGNWPIARTVLPDPTKRKNQRPKRGEGLVPRPFSETIFHAMEARASGTRAQQVATPAAAAAPASPVAVLPSHVARPQPAGRSATKITTGRRRGAPTAAAPPAPPAAIVLGLDGENDARSDTPVSEA